MEVAIPLVLSSLTREEGGRPSPHPLKKNKKHGDGHLTIPLRKNSKNGGGQPSLCLNLLEVISFSNRKGVAIP